MYGLKLNIAHMRVYNESVSDRIKCKAYERPSTQVTSVGGKTGAVQLSYPPTGLATHLRFCFFTFCFSS